MNALPLAAVLAFPLIALAPLSHAQDAAEGERLFRTRCGSCHTLEAGQNRVGPSLAGLFGRPAGSLEGARYSPGLKASGITWNEQTLDTYLANPRIAVTGTTMTVSVADAAQRGAIIAYLRAQPSTQSQSPAQTQPTAQQ